MSNICPKCETNNPDAVKFCGECGTQLPSLEDIEVTETMEAPKEELDIKNEDAFKSLHQNFCYWMMENIKTAKRRKNDKPSFGQAAKVADIILKVAVYYCHLCKSDILHYLNTAVDTPILKHIKKKSAMTELRGIQTVAQIDESLYYLLQKQILNEIDEVFGGKILAVQYDDIIWRSLNR